MILHLAELLTAFVAGLYVGYRYARSKFATAVSTVVADVKKL
jgi:hypothetical protein